MRFNAGPRRARGLIQDGLVGRIFSANVLFGYMVARTVLNRPTWFYKLEESGGGIEDGFRKDAALGAWLGHSWTEKLIHAIVIFIDALDNNYLTRIR